VFTDYLEGCQVLRWCLGTTPKSSQGRVMTQHEGTVWTGPASVEKSGYEFPHAPVVCRAKPWTTAMFVTMHVEDRHGVAMSKLENLAECGRADARADTWVILVVIIGDGMPSFAE
jgi:hypothetical protein